MKVVSKKLTLNSLLVAAENPDGCQGDSAEGNHEGHWIILRGLGGDARLLANLTRYFFALMAEVVSQCQGVVLYVVEAVAAVFGGGVGDGGDFFAQGSKLAEDFVRDVVARCFKVLDCALC